MTPSSIQYMSSVKQGISNFCIFRQNKLSFTFFFSFFVSIAFSQTPPAQYEAEAQAVIDAIQQTDVLTLRQKIAINTRILRFKQGNTWNKLRAYYGFVGGSPSAHKWNWKDPRNTNDAFRLEFVNNPIHDSLGVTFNGVNQYAKTFFAPTNVAVKDLQLSAYLRNNNNSGDLAILGSRASNPFSLTLLASSPQNGPYVALNNGGIATGNSTIAPNGLLVATFSAGGEEQLWKDGILYSWSDRSVNQNDVGIYIGANNNNPSPGGFYANTYQSVSLGQALSPAELKQFNIDEREFQSLLRRQILVSIVFDGDSNTQGSAEFGTRYADQTMTLLGKTFTPVVIGSGGLTSSQMLSSASTRYSEIVHSSSIVVIIIGINDFTLGTTATAVFNNVKQIVLHLTRLNCKNIIIGTYPAAIINSNENLQRLAYNQLLKDSSLFYGFKVADIAAEPEMSTHSYTYYKDNFHWNTAGAAVAANVVKNAILSPFPKHSTWKGLTTDINNEDNWFDTKTDSTYSLWVPTGTAAMPIISDSLEVKHLSVDYGSTMTVAGKLKLFGALNVTGKITASSGVIELAGTSQQSIPAQAFDQDIIKNLILNNQSGVSLAGSLRITDKLTLQKGLFSSNNYLTLGSSATNTARVAPLGAGASITGNVTVERYLPYYNVPGLHSGRSWRLLTAPVTGTTINAAWQEGQVFNGSNHSGALVNNYGTIITGHGMGSAANANNKGFDFWSAISNSTSSLRQYFITGNAGNWSNFLPSTYIPIDTLPAYMVFVRGDRTKMLAENGTNATTLRSKGLLKTGNIPVVVNPALGYTLIGNPYAAPLDFEKVYQAAGGTAGADGKIKHRFWLWDANLSTAGAYRLIEWQGGLQYSSTPYYLDSLGSSTDGANNRFIESGSGFFVEPANGGGAFQIQEQHKADSMPTQTVFRTTSFSQPKLYINLKLGDASNSVLADGIQVRFDDDYSAGVGSDDIGKPANFNETLAARRMNMSLMVEVRPLFTSVDTVFLWLTNTNNRNYQLVIKADQFSSLNVNAILFDQYTGISYPINMEGGLTNYAFSITSEILSRNADRFRIVLYKAVSLPTNMVSLSANRSAQAVDVSWSSETDGNAQTYLLERSANGVNFNVINTTASKQSLQPVTYSYKDEKAPQSILYYRVKRIDANMSAEFSAVVKVNNIHSNATLSVFPNPIVGSQLSITIRNVPEGQYQLTIVNALGQVVTSRLVMHTGNETYHALSLPAALHAGNYQVQVAGAEVLIAEKIILHK